MKVSGGTNKHVQAWEDGKPIYREDGKVLKGPNYKEPHLRPSVMPTPIELKIPWSQYNESIENLRRLKVPLQLDELIEKEEVDDDELISTGRVQSWIDDPSGRLPVSCTVF